MISLDSDSDTICSLITPPGRSGVGVIRISGARSVELARVLAPKLPIDLTTHKSYLVNLLEPGTGLLIDKVLVCCFLKGHSFTGEESVEISCHGSPIVLNEVLRLLIDLGCRVSERGEFSRRAFLNGKLDLPQVEGILNLIESNSKASASMAIRQIDGQLSAKISFIEERLSYVLANFEASIDFVEQDIDIIDYDKTESLIGSLLAELKALADTYRQGRVIHEGLRIAIVGIPNVGKSSFLNTLTSQDRAIVSEIPGTTRDVIDVTIQISGLSIQLLDTAGIHNSSDRIENLGIDRSKKAIDGADYVFLLVDSTRIKESLENSDLVSLFVNKNVVLVLTKLDLVSEPDGLDSQVFDHLSSHDHLTTLRGASLLRTSTQDPELMVNIMSYLQGICADYLVEDGAVVQSSRHYELLKMAHDFVSESFDLVKQRESVEFISVGLYEAIYKLQEIIGKKFDDDIMDRVFRDFCIGK